MRDLASLATLHTVKGGLKIYHSLNFLLDTCLLQKQQHRYLTCSVSVLRRKLTLFSGGVSEHLFIFTFSWNGIKSVCWFSRRREWFTQRLQQSPFTCPHSNHCFSSETVHWFLFSYSGELRSVGEDTWECMFYVRWQKKKHSWTLHSFLLKCKAFTFFTVKTIM